MASTNRLSPIPHPPTKPVVGNMLSLDSSAPTQNLARLAKELGPIFWLDMMGTPFVVVSGHDLVDELSDEKRFDKAVKGSLRRVRAVADKKDMLGAMMTGVDRATGEQLDDVNIRYQINTFLIAGHETTSGMLSCTLYALLKHPEVLRKAYEEVDRVLGPDIDARPTYQQVTQLTYITQILKEALRLWPPAPAYGISPLKDETIGGKY